MSAKPQRDGFTLLELMVVVLLIGILSSVAVPSFLSYQARSRRSEAFINLQSLARSQVTYKAERDIYFSTDNAYPDFTAQNNGVLSTLKMTWNAEAETNFAAIGWKPEGKVFYAYEVNTDIVDLACLCDGCFTATAYGDVDGDGGFSAVMFVHRDAAGLSCNSRLWSLGPPTQLSTGDPVYDEVSINRLADLY